MNDLAGSRILITGGAGFIGSHVADQLLAGEDVREVLLLDTLLRGSRENVDAAARSGRGRLVVGDIRDRELIGKLCDGVDYVIHLAALRITHCAEHPREALQVMVDGTFNVVEACLEARVKKLVAASTASVYGAADVFPTPEDHHPYNNRTLYGAAKLSNELLYRAFHDLHGLAYTALRYFNVYGPRMDRVGRYTEVLIRWHDRIARGEPPLVFGAGHQTMDLVYVEDVARATVLALRSPARDAVVNVATQRETSLRELCAALLAAMGSPLQPAHVALPAERKAVEVERRLGDASRARALLGFEARVGLEEGLARLVAWLGEHDVPAP